MKKLIKTKEEHEAALKRLDEIFLAEEGTPEGDEAEFLVLLIGDYENRQNPINRIDINWLNRHEVGVPDRSCHILLIKEGDPRNHGYRESPLLCR